MEENDEEEKQELLQLPQGIGQNLTFNTLNTVGRVTVNDKICETVDQIIRRHEAEYTRLYVELDEMDDTDTDNPRWVHTARWVPFCIS